MLAIAARMTKAIGSLVGTAVVLGALASLPARSALAASSLSPLLRETTDHGRAAPTTPMYVVVGLSLRDGEGLEAFLADVQDPTSPRYGRFLSQADFNALYAPTEAAEATVVAHLERSGLRVTDRVPNRLLVGARGSAAAIERAFGVAVHAVSFRGAPHYAALDDPSFPPDIAASVVGVTGLDDLVARRPHVSAGDPVLAPDAMLGSNCCHLSPNDLTTLYDNTTTYAGTGQTIVIAGAFAWKDTDITSFSAQWGLPQLPAGSGQVCTGAAGASGCKFSSQSSIEVALDVEYAHGTAPGARILNYMSASTSLANFTTMYNRIVTDNPGHVVTTSWGACEAGVSSATQQTDDNIFANANAVGQSWFAASGDAGSRDCSNVLTVDNPANSPHVMGVGGTTPACSAGLTSSRPACAGYGSESGWAGSGGGVSQLFARPAFQAGCGVPAGTRRLVPDVALEADPAPGNYVALNGAWYSVGGTSGAAPQWAGFLALLDQKLAGSGVGNPGARLYGLCGTSAFHDVTTGLNGDYAAGVGYDLVTGIGSIEARNLLALAAPASSTTTSSSTTTRPPTTTTTSTTSSTTRPPPTTTTTSTSTTTTTTAPPCGFA
jgi:subtilase family serine protease